MQVFLCWSGERSKAVALTLSDWIPRVIQAVDPWMSHDTDKGARWSPEIAERLELSKVGIICLSKIGVGNGIRRPLPPNPLCGSPATGSPVSCFHIGIGAPIDGLRTL